MDGWLCIDGWMHACMHGWIDGWGMCASPASWGFIFGAARGRCYRIVSAWHGRWHGFAHIWLALNRTIHHNTISESFVCNVALCCANSFNIFQCTVSPVLESDTMECGCGGVFWWCGGNHSDSQDTRWLIVRSGVANGFVQRIRKPILLNGENDYQPLDFVSFPSISRQTQYSYIYNVYIYIYILYVCIYIYIYCTSPKNPPKIIFHWHLQCFRSNLVYIYIFFRRYNFSWK